MRKGQDAGRIKLPGWFSLGKYQRTAALDAAGWYWQITVRQVCGSQLRDMRAPNRIFPERDDAVRLALTRLREEPICDLTRNPFDDEAFSFCRNLKFPEVPVVRSMTFYDLYRLDSRINRILPQHRIGEAHRMVDLCPLTPGRTLSPSAMDESRSNERVFLARRGSDYDRFGVPKLRAETSFRAASPKFTEPSTKKIGDEEARSGRGGMVPAKGPALYGSPSLGRRAAVRNNQSGHRERTRTG